MNRLPQSIEGSFKAGADLTTSTEGISGRCRDLLQRLNPAQHQATADHLVNPCGRIQERQSTYSSAMNSVGPAICRPEHLIADYERFNSSNDSICPWSWNYRGCWHQTCPPIVTHRWVWVASIPIPVSPGDQQGCCSSLLPHKTVSALDNLRACCHP